MHFWASGIFLLHESWISGPWLPAYVQQVLCKCSWLPSIPKSRGLPFEMATTKCVCVDYVTTDESKQPHHFASHLGCFPFPLFPSTGRVAFLPSGGRKLQVARRAEEQLGSVKAMATMRTTILAQRWKHWKGDHFRWGSELMVAVDFLSTWILNNDAGIRFASSYFVYGLPVLLTLLHLSIWPSVKAMVTHTWAKCCFVALGLRQEITKVEICIHRDCKSCLAIGIGKGHVIWWVWGNHTRSWNILVAQHFVKWTVWCIQFSVTSAEEEEEERSWGNNLRISQKELLSRCRPDLALLIPFGETHCFTNQETHLASGTQPVASVFVPHVWLPKPVSNNVEQPRRLAAFSR